MAKILVTAPSVDIDAKGPLAASVAESSLGGIGFGSPTVYSTPGTYQYAIGADTRFLYILGTGGAGGGGTSTSSNTNNQGDSGAVGAVISEMVAVPTNLRGTSIAVVVGAGGTGGLAGGNNAGTAGGDSTIAALGRIAGGGGGGNGYTGIGNPPHGGLPTGLGFQGLGGVQGSGVVPTAVTAAGGQYGHPLAVSGAGNYNNLAGGNASGGGDGAGGGFWAISAQ